MECDVILLDDNGNFNIERKRWGLITKNGTLKKPLYTDERDLIKMCFESLCFNARSDTLYSKPTFSKLAHGGRSCIIALDGYFEWKSHPIPKMNKIKQPYFVYRKQLDCTAQQQQRREPLLIAGLWTKVQTGNADAPELGTFTMLTTDASEQIKWLHHRMPICIWDIDLAKKWLTQPSETLKKSLDDAARCSINCFGWHKVTPKMSKLTFRSEEAIMEVTEKTQSVKHFFAAERSLGKQEKKSTKNPSSCNHSISEKKNKVNEISNITSFTSTTADASKESRLTPTKYGNQRPKISHTRVVPNKKKNCTKNKLKRSPTPNLKRQMPIDCFFKKFPK